MPRAHATLSPPNRHGRASSGSAAAKPSPGTGFPAAGAMLSPSPLLLASSPAASQHPSPALCFATPRSGTDAARRTPAEGGTRWVSPRTALRQDPGALAVGAGGTGMAEATRAPVGAPNLSSIPAAPLCIPALASPRRLHHLHPSTPQLPLSPRPPPRGTGSPVLRHS